MCHDGHFPAGAQGMIVVQDRVQTITAVSKPTISSKWLHLWQHDAGTECFPLVGGMNAGNRLLSEAQGWVGWTENGPGHHLVSAQVQR